MTVAQTQMLPGPGPVAKHEFYYEGSDTLKPGYLLCLNADSGTATAVNGERTCLVEKPTAANLRFFAGVVGEGKPEYPGPCRIPLVVPTKFVQMCNIYADVTAVQGTVVLTLKAGSYIAGKIGEGPVIAIAAQTVDRDTTNGLVQCELLALSAADRMPEILSESRTAVQLPTAEIWNNFPLAQMRVDPYLGSLLDLDFRRGDGIPTRIFEDTTGLIAPVIAAGPGEMIFFSSADNDAAEAQWTDCPIDIAGGGNWAFEFRAKGENITTDVACWFIGLLQAQVLAGDIEADNGAALTDADFLGFNTISTATDELDTTYRLEGQAVNVHAAEIVTLAANTYFTAGLYYNGTDILQYVNGVNVGTNILGTGDMDQADFPLALVLCPTIALKGLNAADFDLTIDWLRFAQAPQ